MSFLVPGDPGPAKSRKSMKIITDIKVIKKYFGVQNSRPSRLPAVVSPSSVGVRIKTGYVGWPSRRVLSRELVFEANRAS